MAQNKQQFMAATEENTSRATTSWQFPSDLITNPTYGQNYMMFTAMKVSGGVDTRTLKFALAEGSPTSVVLPIPTGVNAQYQNNWDQSDVSGPEAAMASKATGVMQAIQRISSQDSITGMGSEAVKAVGNFGSNVVAGIKSVGSDLPGAAKAANTAGAGVVNEMMGFGMTTPGISNLLAGAQFDLGIRALNQTMMSYGGPGFRSFSWSYSLKPLSATEAKIAQGIVDFFKVRSMPAQSEVQYTRIYNLPDVFRIQFYNEDGESKFISKIGHCACTDVNVTYGGEKFTTFAGSHSPIQIDITLSFKELELLNRQAVANEKGTGVWPEETYTKNAKKIPEPPNVMDLTAAGGIS
jgi:hypothetical protein